MARRDMHTLTRRLVAAAALLVAAASPAFAQQVPDPNFDARVATPAFASDGPRVLLDEAHQNFHTTGGRYKPFVDLVTSDGYRVSANASPFTRETLAGHRILVIANARGAAAPGDPAFATGPSGRPFGMNRSGIDNRQFALNVMHWLSGLLDPGTLRP